MNLERKVTVRLDLDRFDQLDDIARREGFTVSVIVRHLVCRFLEQERRLKVNRHE
jgi:predicted DNA-binding ribbon-helix-helix protein